MEFVDLIFLISFLSALGITGAKVYNISSVGKAYELRTGFLLFIGYLLSFGVSLVVVLHDAGTNLIYLSFYQLVVWFLVLNLLFMVVELFIYMSTKVDNETAKSYKSFDAMKLKMRP